MRSFCLAVAGIVAASVLTGAPPPAPPPVRTIPVAGLGALQISQAAESSVINYDFDMGDDSDLFDEIDPAALAAVVQEINTRHPRLSDTMKEIIDTHPLGLAKTSTAEDWADFHGTVTVTAEGLRLTVPEGDVNANAGLWWQFGAIALGTLVMIAVRVVCIGTLTGTGAVLVAPACGYIAGFLGGFVRGVIIQAVDHTLTDPTQWAVTLVTSMVAGFGVAAWESGINTWAARTLPRFLRTAAAFFREMGLPNWLNPLRPYLNQAADTATELAEVLPDVVAATPAPPPTDNGGGAGTGNGGGAGTGNGGGAGTGTGKLKVMVVGDSMTQGDQGDWTWRYRLWQWFQSQGVAVDFVGPYTGTKPPDVPQAPFPPALQGEVVGAIGPRTNGTYAVGASPLFDSEHFAVWGRQAAQDMNLIKTQVATFQPDMLLVGLGFNDMGWFVSDAAGTLTSMKTLVDQARAAKPSLKFALANVPQRSFIGGRDDLPVKTDTYNRALAAAIPSWSTAASPVKLVDWRGNYRCETGGCPAGYDGLHPNALGEYQIAYAYEKTLHDGYGIGSSVPAVPAQIPARPTPVPGRIVAKTSPAGILVTWDPVYGAHGYQIRYRLVGQSDWTESGAGAGRYDKTWTFDGQQWEFQVRTNNGDTVSAWSGTVSAVSHPQTSPPPVGIVTRATATGIDVSWGQPTGAYTNTIDRYQLIVWDRDTPGAYIEGTAVKGKSVHYDGMKPGHRLSVWVVTWNAAGGGIPGGARPIVVGGGTPPAPANLKVVSTDPTTVQLSWTGSSQAAGYRVWVRNVTTGGVLTADENIADGPTAGIAFLFPGVWNFEFCVSAVNGAAESGKSNCVVAPRPAGS